MTPRRRARWLVVAALGLVGLPQRVQAQTPSYAAGSPLDTTGEFAILREIDRANARGIAVEPLLAKVREGRLKRASLPRIAHAVAALAVRLDSARAALGSHAPADELSAAADALAAGASTAALRAIRSASPVGPIGGALGTLAQLVASGVPAKTATAMVVELLRRSATAAQLVAFGNAVESDAAGGVPAEESALFRLHGIGTPGGSSAASVGTDAPTMGPTSAQSTRPPVPSTPKRRP